MRLPLAGFACSSVLCAACGGAGGVDGTIEGRSFEVAEAISATVQMGGYRDWGGVVLVSSRSGICDALSNGVALAGVQLLYITIDSWDSTKATETAPDGAGAFPVFDLSGAQPDGPGATVEYLSNDAQCQEADAITVGVDGTINLSAVGDDGSYAGSGKVRLDSGDLVTLDFSAKPCGSLSYLAFGQFQSTSCK